MLAVAIQTGLRASELTTLTIDDIHLANPGAHLSCHGKARKQRITPLTGSIATLLRTWPAGPPTRCFPPTEATGSAGTPCNDASPNTPAPRDLRVSPAAQADDRMACLVPKEVKDQPSRPLPDKRRTWNELCPSSRTGSRASLVAAD